jgi:hypothetical protein
LFISQLVTLLCCEQIPPSYRYTLGHESSTSLQLQSCVILDVLDRADDDGLTHALTHCRWDDGSDAVQQFIR